MSEWSGMNRDQCDIARRWCIFNCWGWPPDLSMPESMDERAEVARAQMAKAVRAIGINRCLEYWNSDEFKEAAKNITPVFGRLAE